MEILKVNTKKQRIVVAPLGDIQWAGDDGASAKEHVKRHIDAVLKQDGWFLGMGDYIDFLSPSNRARLAGAQLYDTSKKVIKSKAEYLVEEVYQDILAPTKGRWLGLLEGHHFYEDAGETSDQWLAEMLGAQFLGTSAFVRLEPSGVVIWAHHGRGGGQLPTASLNRLYHVAQGLAGADVYMMGHSTKNGTVRMSRPRPDWATNELRHDDVHLVCTGGFSKSCIVGHRDGTIPRGEYAEQGMMTPSPLSAPLIYINGKAHDRVRVSV